MSVIRRVLLLTLAVIGVYYSYQTITINPTYENNMYLLPITTTRVKYNQTEVNYMECDLATVSNIVLNMKEDGFEISSYYATQDELDIVLNRDDISVRINYDRLHNFTTFSAPYEKSYLPMTYIIKRNDNF